MRAQKVTVNASDGIKVVSLDTSKVREKFLNSYFDFDLKALIGEDGKQALVDAKEEMATLIAENPPALHEIEQPTHALPPGLSHPIAYSPGDRILT